MDFLTIFNRLCNEKNVSPNKVCASCGLSNSTYSYWKRSNAVPNDTTLIRIAEYFGVTPDYLSGKDFQEGSEARKAGEVVEWLEDNGYEYQEHENGQVSISLGGKILWFNNADFITECLAIHTVAQEGFELSMSDWTTRHFGETKIYLDEYEKGLLELLRQLEPIDKIKVIGQITELCKECEKNTATTGTKKNVG